MCSPNYNNWPRASKTSMIESMGVSKNQEALLSTPKSRALITRTPTKDPQFIEAAVSPPAGVVVPLGDGGHRGIRTSGSRRHRVCSEASARAPYVRESLKVSRRAPLKGWYKELSSL